MTEADYLKLAAGVFFVATAVMGLVRPTWVWGGVPAFGGRLAHHRRLRTVIIMAYTTIGLSLMVARLP